MKKTPLYSRARAPSQPPSQPIGTPPRAPDASAAAARSGITPAGVAATPHTGSAPSRRAAWRARLARHERALWVGSLLAVVTLNLAWQAPWREHPAALTMAQIDAAMRRSIEDKPLTAPTARAYDAIIGSVVRVTGLMTEGDDGSDDAARAPAERGVGTGVVIIDNGTILTSLHVIQGARRLRVTFMDGTDSEAVLVSSQPDNDLAVLRAKTIPDDLEAATMRSTADLAPGDEVLAVGFPFGIGPSAAAGVVSGLKREFRSPEGQHTLSNLIQFDAAANPGNSGGPLVTMDGDVVGIVTAILNPTRQRTFIGIGFAVPIENAAAAAGIPPF